MEAPPMQAPRTDAPRRALFSGDRDTTPSVSYTHLTLPTNREV